MQCLSESAQNNSSSATASSNLIQNISCFICLQVDSYQESDFSTQSLRFISQYLKIPFDYLEDITGKYFDDNVEANISTLADPSVPICSTCALITSKLNSLIQQLELTQMLINYQMQNLNERFKTPKTNSDSNYCGTESKCSEKLEPTSSRTVLAEACKFKTSH